MTSIQTYKQASKKTNFTVDLTWWGSLRLAPITELLDDSFYNDIYSSIPFVATYLKILLLLVTIPAIIIPAVVIIHIIGKTKELHTKYCLFVVNLFITDILISIQYCSEIFIMTLYSECTSVTLLMLLFLYHKWLHNIASFF